MTACVLSCTTPTMLPNVDRPIAEQAVRSTTIATTSEKLERVFVPPPEIDHRLLPVFLRPGLKSGGMKTGVPHVQAALRDKDFHRPIRRRYGFTPLSLGTHELTNPLALTLLHMAMRELHREADDSPKVERES
jgi:hypothetical protein